MNFKVILVSGWLLAMLSGLVYSHCENIKLPNGEKVYRNGIEYVLGGCMQIGYSNHNHWCECRLYESNNQGPKGHRGIQSKFSFVPPATAHKRNIHKSILGPEGASGPQTMTLTCGDPSDSGPPPDQYGTN